MDHKNRLSADQERVESQRVAEINRSLLVRAGAKHRASERRLKVRVLPKFFIRWVKVMQRRNHAFFAPLAVY